MGILTVMKKLFLSGLILCTLPFLFCCGKNDEPLDARVTMKARVTALGEKIEVEVTESEYTFGTHLVITADRTEYYGKGGERISRSDIKVGDLVEIKYGGQVMMSYPPQIVAARIAII